MNHPQHLASGQEPSCLPVGTFPLSCVDVGPEVWAMSMRDRGMRRLGARAWVPHALACCSDTGEGRGML